MYLVKLVFLFFSVRPCLGKKDFTFLIRLLIFPWVLFWLWLSHSEKAWISGPRGLIALQFGSCDPNRVFFYHKPSSFLLCSAGGYSYTYLDCFSSFLGKELIFTFVHRLEGNCCSICGIPLSTRFRCPGEQTCSADCQKWRLTGTIFLYERSLY